MERRRARSLMQFLYFGLAALATLLSVKSSWHYGFFFTPFPALLTGLFIVCASACAVTARDMIKPLAWLGEANPPEFSPSALRIAIICMSSFVMFYSSLKVVAVGSFDSSPNAVERANFIINAEYFLFGSKRAERWMYLFGRRALVLGNYKVSDQFLEPYLQSLIAHKRSELRIEWARTLLRWNSQLQSSPQVDHTIRVQPKHLRMGG